MDASEQSSAVEGDQEASVLGNLPRSRPSVRSPRREDAQAKSRAEADRARSRQGARADATTAASDETDDSAERPMSRERELEELAKAGLSLAGGAATLGLKAAGRAAAALRGAVERR